MFQYIFAQYYDNYHMMDSSDWWWGFGMMIFWVVVLIFITVIIVRFLSRDSNTHNNQNTPLEIAKSRYAKGEINKKEFEQLKNDLKSR